MFKRQHHCRLCDSTCCDDCSKKKAVVDGSSSGSSTQVRCCDACFNYLSHKIEKQKIRNIRKNKSKSSSRIVDTGDTSKKKTMTMESSNKRSSAASAIAVDPSIAKSKLFGAAGIRRAAADEEETKSMRVQGGLSKTMSAMSEVKDRLMDRGEKLGRLNDKSGDIANAAEDFAKLAKQLNQQQSRRWF